jgi:hypothetical protein
MNIEASSIFESAARSALFRVMLRRWLALLGRTALPAALVLLSVFVPGWWSDAGASGVLMIVFAWLVVTLSFTFWRRPGAYEALALWDQAAGRREAFATAWWFSCQKRRTDSEQGHLDSQAAILPLARADLSRLLPIQIPSRVWIVPVLALVAVSVPFFVNRAAREQPLDELAAEGIRQEAKRIAEKEWDRKKLDGLTDREKSELEKLRQNLAKTAKDLESDSGKGAREVLSAIEKNARDAEKLAREIGADRDAWASEKMIAALRSHADTADLGDAVAGKNAPNAATAAGTLSGTLKAEDTSPEVGARLSDSLETVRKESEQEDRQRTVGQHVIAAGEQLSARKNAQAASEFEKLAEKMRDLARREETRKELEKLAQQLRDAGSQSGEDGAGGMQQIAAAGQEGQSQDAGQGAQTPQVPQSNPQQRNQQLSPPGLNQNSQQQQMMQPSSGAGGQQQQLPMISQLQGQPGKGAGKGDGKPMLMAPVPGQKGEPPKGPPQAIIMGDGQPDRPDGAISFTVPGGKQPGVGKAELKNNPTEVQKTANQSVVNAQSGNEGRSTTRAIEGGVREESANRSASALAVDFIQAEEAALDEAALPAARREQVRRYFNELRKRLEKQD